jgi:hypothetical protein
MAFMAAAPLISTAVGGLTSLFTKGCGPSAEEKQQFAMQTDIERHLMDSFNTRLADQKGTINQLNLGLSNLAAGKFPPGMDAATLASFTSGAITRTAASYRNAAQAVQSAMAGRGGGAADPTGTLSGPEAMVVGDIAAKGAMEESELLQQVQQENWQAGRENYMNYISGLSKMAELQDPSRLAGTLIESTKTPTALAETMRKQQSQMAGDIGGFVSDITSAGLSAFGKARSAPQVKNTGFIPTSQQSASFFAGGVPTVENPQLIAPVPQDEFATAG